MRAGLGCRLQSGPHLQPRPQPTAGQRLTLCHALGSSTDQGSGPTGFKSTGRLRKATAGPQDGAGPIVSRVMGHQTLTVPLWGGSQCDCSHLLRRRSCRGRRFHRPQSQEVAEQRPLPTLQAGPPRVCATLNRKRYVGGAAHSFIHSSKNSDQSSGPSPELGAQDHG